MNKLKLEMEFQDQGGKRFNLNLDDPREDLTGEEIRLAMDDVILKNVFFTKEGDLEVPVGARIITTSIENIEI